MALQKQSVPVPLSLGLDQKTDPWQVVPGKFLSLINYVFEKGKRLTKRNGFPKIASLPSAADATTLTTFNDNLTAIGTRLYAFSSGPMTWLDMGRTQPVQLSVRPIVRTAYSQSACDAAVSSDGIVCSVFLDGDGSYKYQIVNENGQALYPITALPVTSNVPRVFTLGNYFVITFLVTVTATPHLRYIAISLSNLSNPGSPVDISATVGSTTTSGYDGLVSGDFLYLAWDGSDGGGAIHTFRLSNNLNGTTGDTLSGFSASLLSIGIDTSGSTSTIWVSIWKTGNAYAASLDQNLLTTLPFTQFLAAVTITELTSTADNGILTAIYQITNTYSFSAVRSDYLAYKTVTAAGVVSSQNIILRSVGLASKAFLFNNDSYMLATYGGSYQPTYLLIDLLGSIVAKVAYSNGGGYLTTQVLPNYSIQGNIVHIGYLLKDLLTSVNKTQNAPSINGVYSQTGVNVVSFDLSNDSPLITAEIGGSLYIAGGILWQYDGFKPVEQGFHVWPEDMKLTGSAVGGTMTAQQYFYVATYEWTDGAGIVNRSAPSVPLSVTTTGATSSVTVDIPTLRLTYKSSLNKVRVCIYRWSTGQQIYYMVTSVTAPLLNSTTVDSVQFIDTQSDSAIVGNAILYTTGGVVENIGAPACKSVTLSQNRLMLIEAEDTNLVWFSKQVIEGTGVEMSDLFTKFIPPTQGSQGSTGPTFTICPMDDKTILTKRNACYYFTGVGPDNTGNGEFSETIYITSAIGSTNQQSVVLTPFGIMMDTDKGRWMLGRDLSTKYVGDGVEDSNNVVSNSALTIPGTNQVRVVLNNNRMLMYDYYYQQWGEFTNILAVSSCLYQNKHTYLNSNGEVFQETPGIYIDGSRPVLGGFKTSWFNLAGLQGFERLYFMFLLGQYYSPHKSILGIAYDYNESLSQQVLLSPDNFSPAYGGQVPYTFYGDDSPYGGPGDVEQYRVFPRLQKCQAFQLTFQEAYDPSHNVSPGQGLSLSGLNLIVGTKGGYPRLPASKATS